jgi:pyruvate dehydrogenase E2 component (dihydrolipoamide acetyltransferase)
MAELLRMPEVSANLESAILSTWSIDEGASFSAKDVIAVIETEKAVVDYEIETSGVLVRKLVADGAEVAVGDPIAVLAGVGESIADVDAVVAELAGAAAAVTAAAEGALQAPAAAAPVAGAGAVDAPRIFSSPLARKLAREAGLDVTVLTGTGPNGRIVRRDVEAAVASGAASVTSPAPAPTSAPAAQPVIAAGGFTDIPHSRLRRAIANRLTESKTTAPHFYVRGSADVSALLRMREEINTGAELRISVNDLLIKAIAKAHTSVPGLNVIWLPDAIRQFASVDISVAIATPGGLVTPVVRGADRLSVTEISRIVKDFAERGRAGRLQQQELEGGTVSISNLGMFGTEDFAAIINPPQASILAVGATREEPVVRDGQLGIGTVMRYTLSVDHRPVDGVLAAEWMREFTMLLEHPAKILA